MRRLFVLPLIVICLAVPSAPAAEDLKTTLKPDGFDPAAFTDWFDGQEQPVTPGNGNDKNRQPQAIVWTTGSSPSHSGLAFGQSKSPGVRHLRIGLNSAVPAGAVLIRGGVRVSVLHPDAAYPGNLADDSQWIPAERIAGGKVSTDAEGDRENYHLWTLPRTVSTRAVRFTHVAAVTDKEYAGWIGGAYLLPARLANVATQSAAAVSTNDRSAAKLVNEHIDPVWEQWANLPARGEGERARIISPADPEWAILTWPADVKLRGIGVAFAGFADADVETYTGPADVHPREADAGSWKRLGKFADLKCGYPSTLPIDWLDFGADVTTRAIRVRMTRAMSGNMHPHVQNHGRDGKRVWAGELIALAPLADEAGLKSLVLPTIQQKQQPPIAVRFTLPEPGWVTLVIEDAAGKRVRNLVADTWFDQGDNTAWWDGSNDLGRDPSAAKHGLYYLPTQFVTPGDYRVRGLWRKQVQAKYEFGVYTEGATPWETADRTGGWLSNHTPPSAVLYVPDAPTADGKTKPSMLIGSYVSEGTAGLAWVDLDGNKWRGQNWVGGNWTAAPYLARDAGPKRIPAHYAYVASAWSAGDNKAKPSKGEIRLTALTAGEDKSIVKVPFDPAGDATGDAHWGAQIGGLAVHDGIAAISLPATNQLLLIDIAAGKVVRTYANGKGRSDLKAPRGLAFTPSGELLLLAADQLLAIAEPTSDKPGAGRTIVQNLDQPFGLCTDPAGNLYIAERGKSHQVKVFDPSGKPLRTIGTAGVPSTGKYDSARMNNPRGVAVDPQGRLWVAEEDYHPKRVSVWANDGKLVRAFYGPAEYGGGGSIDPADKNRFHYYGMEFHLDWDKGTHQLAHVFYRPDTATMPLSFRAGLPQTPIHHAGNRYWTNAYNSSPTGGHGSAFIFADRGGVAVPIAGCGRANDWDLLKTPAFASVWPEGTDPRSNPHADKASFFIWTDANADGHAQPPETRLIRGRSGGVTVMDDLSFVVTRLNEKTVQFKPTSIDQQVPHYDITKPAVLAEQPNTPPSSGGDQALIAPGGWVVHTTAPRPFPGSAIGGTKDGAPLWSYPSLWPGLHASHEAPVPDHPGMIIGHTRLLGGIIRGGDIGDGKQGEPMWVINANNGPMHIFTSDGLYVAQLFQDMRTGGPWRMPSAVRGMVANELTPSDENFWPFVTQTADGSVYIVAGRPNCIVSVDGLQTVRRLPDATLTVSADDLNHARDYFVQAEAARQAARGRSTLAVALRADAPAVDGNLADWQSADWADIDRRGSRAYFNSSSKPYDVSGAVAVSGDRLFAAWKTGDKDLLRNAGDVPYALFKTGGALDLMIGASDPAADDRRSSPVPGDVRLLITRVGDRTRALVYRQRVAAGDPTQPVPFSSPGRTIPFDRVDDISDQVQLAVDAVGNYEVSVPLSAIGLKPEAGRSIRGDIGILRGTGTTTTQRVYWSNKATAIVADVPSEAELKPGLWGTWQFVR